MLFGDRSMERNSFGSNANLRSRRIRVLRVGSKLCDRFVSLFLKTGFSQAVMVPRLYRPRRLSRFAIATR